MAGMSGWRESGIRTHDAAEVDEHVRYGRSHQFRTRINLIKAQRIRTKSSENAAKSTKPIDILPLITVWLQVRVLPGPPMKTIILAKEQIFLRTAWPQIVHRN